MKIYKRNGDLVEYDENKLIKALENAFAEVDGRVTKGASYLINSIVYDLTNNIVEDGYTVEEIQDCIEDELMDCKRKDVARAYIRYRYKRELVRQSNTTDETIRELLEDNSEYWSTENSNKNHRLNTTQRDYIAGITSTDIVRRLILPKRIVEAHDAGIIHFHDVDYFLEKARDNCSLINLEDTLQNGTVINGKMIEKPHRLLTATTIATQIITAVASSQYGGTTITLTHLAPFVRDSYNYHLNKYKKRGMDDISAVAFAKEDLNKEIEDAVQTFNYQVNSMQTTNGQAPFLSVFIYLGENKEYTEEVSMLAEEFFKQRLLGMKNEQGVYVTVEFPKLLYVLEPDTIRGGKYYWLTEKAAECTSKRFVPDYISEKKMKELKEGNCFPCINKSCA